MSGIDDTPLRVAIIGAGPRGLGAAEALIAECENQGRDLVLDIFEPHPFAGAGPNFAPDQSLECILNIPNRDISIECATFAAATLPPFVPWLAPDNQGPDRFPPRAELGQYFVERFAEMLASAHDHRSIAHRSNKIERVEGEAGTWSLIAGEDTFGPYTEVLLTLGQPATAPDPQLKRWSDHADQCAAVLTSAYPANALLEQAEDWADKIVAIRGLGLSTLDCIRMLTRGLGCRFEDGT